MLLGLNKVLLKQNVIWMNDLFFLYKRRNILFLISKFSDWNVKKIKIYACSFIFALMWIDVYFGLYFNPLKIFSMLKLTLILLRKAWILIDLWYCHNLLHFLPHFWPTPPLTRNFWAGLIKKIDFAFIQLLLKCS